MYNYFTWYHCPINASNWKSFTTTGFGEHNGLLDWTIKFWIISKFSPIASCCACVNGVEVFNSGEEKRAAAAAAKGLFAGSIEERLERAVEALTGVESLFVGDWTEPEVRALYRT